MAPDYLTKGAEASTRSALGVICLCFLCIILILGLWPFHAPANQVAWVRNGSGIFFGKHGSVISSSSFPEVGPNDNSGCTLEIWLQPEALNSHTVLAFYRPANPLQFSIHQQVSDLVLQVSNRKQRRDPRASRLLIPGILHSRRLSMLTVSSGQSGTTVYSNGFLVKTYSGFKLSSANCTGQMVVANSPFTNDSWSGLLKGLAIYHRDLSPEEVLQHYWTWIRNGRPATSLNEVPIALYLFREGVGETIHNELRFGKDLYIPDRYFVLRQRFLEEPWNEFSLYLGYWLDILKNIVGFIPLGFVFCAYLAANQIKRAIIVAALLGGTVSLTIEVLQAYLPTRDSGMTDILTNTLGTLMGAWLFRYAPVAILFHRALESNWVTNFGRPRAAVRERSFVPTQRNRSNCVS